MSLSEARAELPALLDRVEHGEEVTITRHGRPVAVVLRPDTVRSRRAESALAGAAEVRELMERARNTPLSEVSGLSAEYADELVADIRADRDDS
ncbi:type II toxin-antitoxin system Phd/YefM family antitoxin [Haloactinopolyspora alba]|nr:type II toxin-antitoxin system prevent-host-death family antitoxin [Haloactinopolyspora alba]